ncbi:MULTISPECIES: O-antigen ligase family protein [Tenacibaculum]|uniref:O-antigen ligase family protein n=1 Tax=Tenacibaculum TaxID=104267 RepID=UPI001F0A1F02|nr:MULTISPECIES: O-antigen ligase family protein [Tenacibaculum]MCH3883134.1 hypothetical protein [Tenacibaculum aquimarinum]MDO6600872.1 hypothetical protein [Tenacibaculum sp. 1_MG-2023]
MVKKILSLFIILSFFTRTLAATSAGALGRITLADFFGALAIITFLAYNTKFKIPVLSVGNFMFVILVVPGIMASLAPQKTFLEVVILFFLFLVAVLLYNTFDSKKGLDELIFLFSLAGLIASVTGIWDTLAMFTSLPQIFPSRAAGEAISGFRNGGQAGAYMLVVLTMLIPLRGSSLFNTLVPKTKKTVKLSLIFSSIFLILTGKIAAYIGVGFGVFFYLILRRKFIMLLPLSLFLGLVVFLTPYVEVIAPMLYKRLNSKIQTRIVDNVSGENNLAEEGFIADNFKIAFEVFLEKPLTGGGLGGVGGGNYGSHEIHSTYLKIIGECGIFGIIGYSLFMILFLRVFFLKSSKKLNPYKNYLTLMFPFILGCLVSWSYTYHMRKREFYILLTIVSITYFLAKEFEKELSKKKILE